MFETVTIRVQAHDPTKTTRLMNQILLQSIEITPEMIDLAFCPPRIDHNWFPHEPEEMGLIRWEGEGGFIPPEECNVRQR